MKKALQKLSPEALWASIEPASVLFGEHHWQAQPEAVQRLLRHCIDEGAPLARGAKLEMVGTIKLKDRWYPFDAVQVIDDARGFIWQARVKMGLLTVRGSDRLLDGAGAMQWRLLGLIPLVKAAGTEVSRSAMGRFLAEMIWLPSSLVERSLVWSELSPERLLLTRDFAGEPMQLELQTQAGGGLCANCLERLGDPAGTGEYGLYRFGGLLAGERQFGPYRIPTKVRAGWHLRGDEFAHGGEFFRAEVLAAEFK